MGGIDTCRHQPVDRLSMLEHAEPEAIADLVLQQLEGVGEPSVVATPAALSIVVSVPVARQPSAPPAAMDWLSDDLFAEATA